MHRARLIILVLAVTAGTTAAARAADGGGWQYAGPADYCRDPSRACVLEAANSYLEAVRSHDGDRARLAPEVKRTRNAGEQTAETQWYTRDEMADSLDESEDPVNAVHSIDWVIDGDEAIAFYAIDASYEERGPQAAQTWLAERFHVTAGEIDEIEAIFFFAPGVGNTDRGWTTDSATGGQPATDRDPSWCTDPDTACVLEAATSYLAAQLSQDYGAARLSDDVRRTLNGRDTAGNRIVVEANGVPAHPDAATYQARDARWYVDQTTGDAVVLVALDQTAAPVHRIGQAGAASVHVATIHLAQRLRVTAGLVHEIEQIAWPTAGATPTPTGWEA
jgi:hypothetical protein